MADNVPSNYYFGHGMARLGVRNSSGVVTDFDIELKEVDELSFAIEIDKVEHVSKREAIASKDLSVARMMGLKGKLVIATHDPDMLKVYLFGTKAAVAGGSFTAIAFGTAALGARLPIGGNRKNITSLVITDSAGSPATLVAGTDYEADLDDGTVKFISLGSYVQPFKAAGSEGAGTSVGIITQRVYERYLRFKGINIADGDKKCVVDIYRVQIEPATSWNLLNSGNEVNTYEIGFEALKDPTVDPSAALGQYGNYKELT